MAVSVTIPVFNEEAVIEKVVNDCYKEIIAKIPGSELIIVNDGSTDGTSAVLKSLKQRFTELKIIHSGKNSGHGKALRTAFEQADRPLIFHIDGDDQFNVKDFWQLYNRIEGNDIVAAYRLHRNDSLLRKFLSLILRWINAILFGVSLRDVNAPFKLIRAEVLKDILKEIPRDYSAVPILLPVIARLKGYRIFEAPVAHFARKTGSSTMVGFYLLKLCSIYLADLLRFRYRMARGWLKKA